MKAALRRLVRALVRRLLQWSDLPTGNGLDDARRVQRLCRIEGTPYLEPTASIDNGLGDPEKISIGSNSRIAGSLVVFPQGGCISIGSHCYVGIGSRIWSSERVTIGDDVLVSHNVSISDTNAHELDVAERVRYSRLNFVEGYPKYRGDVEAKPIVIHDGAWLNFGSIVLKGVTIGRGSIVAAGAVVTKDVPEGVVVAGNPARIVKHLSQGAGK